MGNYKHLIKLGLSRYCTPKVTKIDSGFFGLHKIKQRTFYGTRCVDGKAVAYSISSHIVICHCQFVNMVWDRSSLPTEPRCGVACSHRERSVHFQLHHIHCRVVLLRYIENIDSISIYRIVSYRWRKYRNFRYIGINFFIYILPNIHLLLLTSV